MRMRQCLFLCLMLSWTLCSAVEVHTFTNPELEQRYKSLVNELRCLVCQNQTIADSNADLAKDLRRQAYNMIKNGSSDQEITDFMVARYGDFVLYRPPFKAKTALLWGGPGIFLLLGLIILFFTIRRKSQQQIPALDEGAKDRVRALLQEDENNS